MGLIGLLIFDCALHGFYCFVCILLVCCMGFIVLLIFGCVLHGFYHFVDIWLCVVRFSCFVDTWLCVAWVLSF